MMLAGSKWTKVFVIAVFNFLIIYYVLTNFDLSDDKKFVPKFLTRLPKYSLQNDTDSSDVKSTETLIDSMKNILCCQSKEKVMEEISDQEPDIVISKEQRLRLLDSAEIELVTRSPHEPPLLGLQTPKLESLKQFEQLMGARVKLLRRGCAATPQPGSQSSINYGYLYVLKARSLVWCPVYKAASTNWCHNLLHLAGKTEPQVQELIKKHPNQPNDQARVVAPVSGGSEVRQMMAEARGHVSRRGGVTRDRGHVTSLLIVRHPFDRLVSAFRDKLEQCHGMPENCTLRTNWYYNQYGIKIVSQWRGKAENKFGREYFDKKNNFGAPYPVNRSWRDIHYPSWWEFVQYLLQTTPHSYDEHWRPASLYCSVCSGFEFNTILHFENIEAEETLLADRLQASEVIHPRWENKNSKEKQSKEEVLGAYFRLLTDAEILKLYKIYEGDFVNFGYKFNFRRLKLG